MNAFFYLKIPDEFHHFFPYDRRGDDNSPPHCTLIFLENLSRENLYHIDNVLNQVSKIFSNIKCKFGQLKSFPAGEYGCPWFVEIINRDGSLALLRQSLCDALRSKGISVEDKYDKYVPHATLKYLPPDSIFTGSVPTGPFEFSDIFLTIKD